jgi:outer membrane protein
LGAAVAVLGALVSAGAAGAETLDEAITQTLVGDPGLASLRTNIDVAQAGKQSAFAQFLPSLSGSVSYSESWRGAGTIDSNNDGVPDLTVPSSTSDSASAGVDVSQTLFSGGRLIANYSAAKADLQRTIAQYRSQEDGIILQVVQAYAGTLYGEQAVTIQRQEVERLQQEVDAANVRFEAGAGTKTDVYQAEAQLAAARSNLAAAQADLTSQRATYARRVGAMPGTLAKPTPPPVPGSLEAAIDLARQNAPEVAAAEAGVSGAKARTWAAYSQYLPSLSLTGSASRRGDDGFEGFDNDSSSISARLSIPIWTGGRTSAATAQAKAQERGAKFDLADTIRGSQEGTAQAWARLDAAKLRAEASKAQLESASFAAQGAALERREGLRTQLELLDAISSERDAALAVAAAERDVLIDSYQVLQATGQIPRPANAPTVK